MDTTKFENSVRAAGFSAAERKSLAEGCTTSAHAHPFDVHALVLDGSITLTRSGVATTCHAGDEFTMPAGAMHEELVGAKGVTYMVARRHPA